MKREFLKVREGRNIHNVPINEIIHVYSKAGCSEIHLPNGVRRRWNKNLCQILSKLRQHENFVQTHRSFIANVKKVKTYRSHKRGGVIIMMNGSVIDLSKRQKSEFLIQYNSL